MIKLIIFDYNRTLFIPELGCIPRANRDILVALDRLGYNLAVISVDKAGRLIDGITTDGIPILLKKTSEKNILDFSDVLDHFRCIPSETIVVGDRLEEEIRIGNELGCITVWIRNGSADNTLCINLREKPNFEIWDLIEVQSILKQQLNL
jgi:predicted HAD superfamily phosphohydrolase YqeG